MRLLVVRHALAEDKEVFGQTGKSDDLRPLTDQGRRRMRKVARGLAHLVQPELLVTSPLTRAVQTAEILAKALAVEIGSEVDALRPEKEPEAFGKWAASVRGKATVAIVGHEPHLSRLIGWLTTGRIAPFVTLKKGGACLIEFEKSARQAGGSLLWLLQPSQLTEIGR